jgi:rod shape-determining protein MreD
MWYTVCIRIFTVKRQVKCVNYDNNKPKIKRRIIFVVAIIITAIIQNTGSRVNAVFDAHAFLLIPLLISISMFEREIVSALLGALAGLLWDLSAGVDGYNVLVFMLLCAVCSILINRLMQNNIITAVVLGLSSIAVYIALYIMIYIVLDGGGYPLSQILRFYLPSFIFTSLFIPVYYFLVRVVFESNRTVEEY